MHEIQRDILRVIKQRQPVQITLKELGDAVGEPHLQKVKHHLNQLLIKNFLAKDSGGFYRTIEAYQSPQVNNEALLALPIYGSANCGPAELLTEDKIDGHLFISPSLINYRDGMIAIKAVGNSMDNASIKGQSIDSGDYLIVDTRDKDPHDGDYVLSVIDDMANIKRLFKNPRDQTLSLVSESSKTSPPIVINPDSSSYFIAGKVIRVVKSFQKRLSPS